MKSGDRLPTDQKGGCLNPPGRAIRSDNPDAQRSIEVTDRPAAADVGLLRSGLIADNEPFLGPADFRNLAVLARSAGVLDGGLIGETARGFLFVDLFWVAPGRRGAGLGARLLAAAEAEALAPGLPCGLARHLRLPGPPVLRAARLPAVRRAGGIP